FDVATHRDARLERRRALERPAIAERYTCALDLAAVILPPVPPAIGSVEVARARELGEAALDREPQRPELACEHAAHAELTARDVSGGEPTALGEHRRFPAVAVQ